MRWGLHRNVEQRGLRRAPGIAGDYVDRRLTGAAGVKQHRVGSPHRSQDPAVIRQHAPAKRTHHLDGVSARPDMATRRPEHQHVAYLDRDACRERPCGGRYFDQPTHKDLSSLCRSRLRGVGSGSHQDIHVLRFIPFIRKLERLVARGDLLLLRVNFTGECVVRLIDIESTQDRLTVAGDRRRKLIAHD